MTLNVLSLPLGTGWPVKRSPSVKTSRIESVSGRRTYLPLRSVPRWNWDVPLEFLRSAQYAKTGFTELETLLGFFISQTISGQCFLFKDAEDFAVVNQPFGIGDGTSQTFQLVRTYGGFTEPVYNVDTSSLLVYINGVPTTTYTVGSKGNIIFTTSPPLTAVLSWSGSFYWVCSFDEDTVEVARSLKGLSALQSLKFSNEIAP